MADRLMRAQVTIPLVSGVPEDAIVNTFYFDQDDNGILPDPTSSYEGVVNSLGGFYNAFDQVIFPNTIANVARVKIYDMRDPEPRIMRHYEEFAIDDSGDNPMPGEVAICVSFKAAPEAGVNPQRRRGRVFLGPIAQSVGAVGASQLMVSTAALTALNAGAQSLVVPNDIGGSSLTWAIYSPTTDAGGANIDDSFFDVDEGWIDNAFDTQRRRGGVATTRSLFAA